jgi:NAD(P)H dehydrogenase (quinone)
MRILVVYCHPDKSSFASALHDAVLDSFSGHAVTDLDLYGEGFNPVFSVADRVSYGKPEYVAQVERYASQLAEAEGLVLVYPTWWYGMPAMLKGYFDRVWAPGVAYDVRRGGKLDTNRLSQLQRIAVVTTYGSSWWLVRLFMGDPARKVISRGVRHLCGRRCALAWFAHYDMDKDTPKPERLTRFLAQVRRGLETW